MMAASMRSVQFGATTIPFALHRSRARRTAAITVNPNSTVRVIAPPECGEDLADTIVRSRASWILRQWDEQRRRALPCRREFVGGETFRYLGRGYRLVIEDGDSNEAKLIGCTLRVTIRHDASHPQAASLQVQDVLIEWYRQRGQAYLPGVVAEFASRVAVDPPGVLVTSMKTRWGSCTSRGIRFDWRVMMAPRRLVRYIAAHEVCHIRHADHSRAFWRLLERVMPDFAVRHAELATIGPRLSF